MRKCIRSVVLIVWVVILLASTAQAANEDVAASVVVQIRRSAEEVSAQVHQGLAQAIATLVTRWKANLEKTTGLLEQAKKAGRSGLGPQFEEQLSTTMLQAGQDLTEILGRQEPAKAAFHKLEGALTAGEQLYREKHTQVQAAVTQLTEERKKSEAAMVDLAWRHRHVIVHGQLPPEVAGLVRSLEASRRALEMREQIRERQAEVLKAGLGQLAKYRDYVRWLRQLSQEAFAQAHNHILILDDLAELRKPVTEFAQLSQTVRQFGHATVSFSEDVQRTQGVLAQLVSLSLPSYLGEQEELPEVKVQQGQEAEILRRYLEQAQARQTSKSNGR